jgi:predicted nucleotidyltransferase component of viral defense system
LIPKADITAWRHTAPWVSDAQVEQDLILSRILVEIFRNDFLGKKLAFRGGTALHKLYFRPARRYSEDIDLVQVEPEPIGDILDALQAILNPFLGDPKRKLSEDAVTVTYKAESEGPPVVPLRFKVEINTREHFSVLGFEKILFEVRSRWFTGSSTIRSYALDELLATKTRALYQRRKGRDLFDLWLGITEAMGDPARILQILNVYLEKEGTTIDARDFEKNLLDKMKHPGFMSDLRPLLAADMVYDAETAHALMRDLIVSRMDGR